MSHVPSRVEIEKLIDPKWAAIVLAPPSRARARRWLSLEAQRAGLAEDRLLRPEPLAESAHKKGSVRIDQTLSFKVDELRRAEDGRVTVRQSFELAGDARPALAPEAVSPFIAQNPRVLWLRGEEALSRAAAIASQLDARLGRAAAVPVYKVKDTEHWHAVDPWLVEIRVKDTKSAKAGLSGALQEYLEYDEKVRVFGGKWIPARFRKPVDPQEFGKLFYEIAGDAAQLGYRSLPLTVRSASLPGDSYYETGPLGSPGQDEPLANINAPAMWAAVSTRTRSTVHVFLFDFGAETFGPDIPVHEEHSCNAIGQPPSIPLPMGEFGAWLGNPHGAQMASIMGARWNTGSSPSIAGIFGQYSEISLVSVRCQSLVEMATGLDHVAWFMKSHPERPQRAVVVFGHDVLWACQMAAIVPELGFSLDVAKFVDALEEAQLANPDVLAVLPVGNFLLGDSPTIPSLSVGDSTLLVGACGLPPGNTRWANSRWANTSASPRPSLVAPGQSILAPSNVSLSLYVRVSGTSFAAAHVAGVAALLRSVNPTASATDIANYLKNTATPIPGAITAAAVTSGTEDPHTGRGRLNGHAAVIAATS